MNCFLLTHFLCKSVSTSASVAVAILRYFPASVPFSYRMHISLSLSLAEIYTPFIALLLIYSFGYCSLFISLPHILCLFVSFNLISHQFSDGCTYPIIHIESYSTTILRSLSLYTNTQCFPTSDQFNIKLLPCTIAPSLLLLMMIFFSLQSSTKCIQFFCAAFHS